LAFVTYLSGINSDYSTGALGAVLTSEAAGRSVLTRRRQAPC
jgi:hypothetical protein